MGKLGAPFDQYSHGLSVLKEGASRFGGLRWFTKFITQVRLIQDPSQEILADNVSADGRNSDAQIREKHGDFNKSRPFLRALFRSYGRP